MDEIKGEILLPSEVAKLLGICPGQLMILVEIGVIPFRKWGKSIRFIKTELEKWLAMMDVAAFILKAEDPKSGILN